MLGKGLESLIPPSDPVGEVPQEPEKKVVELLPEPLQENLLASPSVLASVPIPAVVSVPVPPPVIPAPSQPAIAPPAFTRGSGPLRQSFPPEARLAPASQRGEKGGSEASEAKREEAHGRGQMSEAIFQIETEKIAPNPHQPRKEFGEESLKELAQSIREFGVLQPLIVTKVEKETPTGIAVSYELIAGERRLMASKLLGLPRVPAIVRIVNTERDRLEMAVIENIQRENLNPIEMARAFSRLQDEFRLTQREIASRLGKSREVVANTLRLLDAPSYIQEAVSKGEISESHARLLLAVTEPDAQEKLFRDLLDRHLTTRELRVRIAARKPLEPVPPSVQQQALSPEFLALEERLSMELGTPVKIAQGENGGKITILFYSPEELKSILERLGGKEE